jgi:hypothetical protein
MCRAGVARRVFRKTPQENVCTVLMTVIDIRVCTVKLVGERAVKGLMLAFFRALHFD